MMQAGKMYPVGPDLPKRVTLVTPPSVFLLDERVFINLGILKVAAVLEQKNILVEHVDLSGTQNYLEAFADHLNQTETKIIGITTTTPQLPAVVTIIRIIRQNRPDMKIILGGPHITLVLSAVKLEIKMGRKGRAHKAMVQLRNLADVLVSGDGEFAIFLALRSDAPQLIDADDPESSLFLTNSTYEETPYPARHLIDFFSYKYEIDGLPSTSLIAQLGCPFSCGFCGGRNSQSLRRVRTRSTESIIRAIRMLYETYHIKGFMFYDDELNVNKNFVNLMNSLQNLQMELGVDFRLRGFVKSKLFTEEQAQAMHNAGFRWILSGFESGSARILENINKRATRDDNFKAITYAKKANLKVKALMSVGHPGESEETIRATHDWLAEVSPDDFDCTIITTYPGTPYYDEAIPHSTLTNVWTYVYQKTNDQLHAYDVDFMKVADYYKGDPNSGYKSFVFTDYLSSDELVKMRNWVENSIRKKLNIPFPKARAALLYEHSTGQGVNVHLPVYILGKSRLEAIGGTSATITREKN
jgi:anaerobic magnesium-protoporphyrin IX monomethyl ester cyclase